MYIYIYMNINMIWMPGTLRWSVPRKHRLIQNVCYLGSSRCMQQIQWVWVCQWSREIACRKTYACLDAALLIITSWICYFALCLKIKCHRQNSHSHRVMISLHFMNTWLWHCFASQLFPVCMWRTNYWFSAQSIHVYIYIYVFLCLHRVYIYIIYILYIYM